MNDSLRKMTDGLNSCDVLKLFLRSILSISYLKKQQKKKKNNKSGQKPWHWHIETFIPSPINAVDIHNYLCLKKKKKKKKK